MHRNRRIARLWITTVLANVGAAYPLHVWATAPDSQKPSRDEPDLIAAEADNESQVLFEADTVTRETDEGAIVAEGDVRAYFGERYLRADRLTYDPSTDVVTAEGNVSITDENMETLFAGSVVLSGDLRDGIVENFSALLQENVRIAAANAIQEQGARTRLNNAVYTACNVCNENGEGKTPTWRIKSLRVTRDLERKVVRFHHAFLELKGVPILYTPYLQGPDPSVERQSGFLTPNIGASSRLGFNFELPYYLAISNSQDATFHPKYTAEDGVLWQGEYRIRGERGYHVLAGGVIDFDNTAPKNIPPDGEPLLPGVRWHYFGRGYRDIGDHWRVSYDFERVSDRTYLRRYDVRRQGDLRQALNRGSTNQLRSNARVAWESGDSRLTFDTYLFQGLRAQDDTATTPYILPLIDFKHDVQTKIAGGDLSVGANIASVYRTGGADSQRFTGVVNWNRDIITRRGHRFRLFTELRSDAYFFQDIDQGTEIYAGLTGAKSDSMVRFAPTVGLEWSYPVARHFGDVRVFLEPRVQLVASPTNVEDAIFNEDSQSIEFDYAGLFDFNKATGYDAFEDGQRMNVGVAAAAEWSSGFTIEGSIGQQFRAQTTDAFVLSSGIGERSSDIVGSLNVSYGSKFGVENRFRLDNESGRIQRAESLAFLNLGPVKSNLSYVRLIEADVVDRREELTARASVKVARHWSVGGAWRVNLNDQEKLMEDPTASRFSTITQDFNVTYTDECSTFGITYRRDRTRDTNLPPDNAVLLTFTLNTLVQ